MKFNLDPKEFKHLVKMVFAMDGAVVYYKSKKIRGIDPSKRRFFEYEIPCESGELKKNVGLNTFTLYSIANRIKNDVEVTIDEAHTYIKHNDTHYKVRNFIVEDKASFKTPTNNTTGIVKIPMKSLLSALKDVQQTDATQVVISAENKSVWFRNADGDSECKITVLDGTSEGKGYSRLSLNLLLETLLPQNNMIDIYLSPKSPTKFIYGKTTYYQSPAR